MCGAWGRWQSIGVMPSGAMPGTLLRDAAFAELWFSLCLLVVRAWTHLQVTRLQAPGLSPERGKFSVAKKAWFQGK